MRKRENLSSTYFHFNLRTVHKRAFSDLYEEALSINRFIYNKPVVVIERSAFPSK